MEGYKVDFDKIKTAISGIDNADDMRLLLAKIIISVYRKNVPVCLGRMHNFDSNNMTMAIEVMHYRHTPHWEDEKLWDLAQFASNEIEQFEARNNKLAHC